MGTGSSRRIAKGEPQDIVQLSKMACLNHSVRFVQHEKSEGFDLRGERIVLGVGRVIRCEWTLIVENVFSPAP
jgi:hypothetical protein